MSKLRMAHLGITLVCTVFFSTLALAGDKKSPIKLSDLPLEDQRDISAVLARELPGVQNFMLTASDSENDNNFGYSVAIDGNTVVVGTIDSSVGEAYVFVKPAGGWKNMTQTAKLTASDGAEGNEFGDWVAIDGNTIAVGARTAAVNGNQAQGEAYVFVKPSKGWKNMTETARLLASDGGAFFDFGTGISVSGNTVVVGAPGPGNNGRPGSAYVFVQPLSGWVNMTQTTELTSSDGMNGDEFGYTVSVSGDTVLVGAGGHDLSVGSAYVFVEPPNGWENTTETAELSASDHAIGSFGSSVAMNGDTAIIGAPSEGNGAAYLFVEPVNGWSNMTETAKLLAPGGVFFGTSVALSLEAAVVGAPFTNPVHQGSAYVFVKPNGGWQSTSKPNLTLAIQFTNGFDNFGESVAISGKTAIIGANDAPTSQPCKPRCVPGSGEAFVFVEQ
ncbi:MAG TPA: hypothetical protein VK763_21560 [Terriglobales bacterium]|nr:hypothetical protein [Terriglobales bacterium]